MMIVRGVDKVPTEQPNPEISSFEFKRIRLAIFHERGQEEPIYHNWTRLLYTSYGKRTCYVLIISASLSDVVGILLLIVKF